ncbi:TIGR03086 family metal-binding protein [Cryptosporangium sp. NPDC048952]|uniref:TIGR03086 family metal-binding protein n=1 Tax=Cryptosporangium sp. NPDC048952 TaxID=3363961 RepID=UPI0037242A88
MHTLIAETAGPTRDVIRNLRDDQLSAPTPCSEYDVRALVNHLLQWGPPLVGAARKQEVAPVEPDADWRKALDAHFDELVEVWSAPEAWQGTTRMGAPVEMPAPMIGGMVLGEVVLHGWDLARATGQSPTWSDTTVIPILEGVRATAEMGREMGVYGPEVPVPTDAPPLDRLLGLTGRNPTWSPA